jgi:hypothetical protein
MRWNQKLIDKHYRFDAVLAKGLKPIESRLVGTEADWLTPEETDWFIEKFSECDGNRSLLKGYDETSERIQINPSDHYGVLTTFGSKSSSSRGGRRLTRKVKNNRM